MPTRDTKPDCQRYGLWARCGPTEPIIQSTGLGVDPHTAHGVCWIGPRLKVHGIGVEVCSMQHTKLRQACVACSIWSQPKAHAVCGTHTRLVLHARSNRPNLDCGPVSCLSSSPRVLMSVTPLIQRNGESVSFTYFKCHNFFGLG